MGDSLTLMEVSAATPRVPDGLTMTPSPFRKQSGAEAPADLIPDNGKAERFNGRFRDEGLNEEVFANLAEARAVIERRS
jgi:integrase-like protein